MGGHNTQVLIFCDLGLKTPIHAPKIGFFGGGGNGGGAMRTANELIYFWGCYLCTTFGRKRSTNATVRVRTDRQTL